MVTGKYMDTIEAGPNWDDDLGGSQVYANNDPNLDGASDEEMRQINEINSTVFFYLPRICNHCLNPGCVAACPQGAIYKRGEDGIVLVSQERCRAWRMCVSGCPYKKTYFNWSTGKAEKCILCYPRLESGQPPACFHSCVGRIRYIGLVLYDADAIEEAAMAPQDQLVMAQRDIIKDPFDPEIIAAAKANGIPDRRSTRRKSRRSTSSSRSGDSRCRCIRSSARCRCCSMCRRWGRCSPRWRTACTTTWPRRQVGAVDELARKIAHPAALYGEPVVGRQ